MTTNFFSPLSFVAVFGSGIRDPGWVKIRIRDPGSEINIPDPQHCIDVQAFSPLYDLAPPPSPSPHSKVDRWHTGRLRKTGERGYGEGEEPNHTTAKKPGPI
jgi:hypothetical protein